MTADQAGHAAITVHTCGWQLSIVGSSAAHLYLDKRQCSDHEGVVDCLGFIHLDVGSGGVDVQTDSTVSAQQAAVQNQILRLLVQLLTALAPESAEEPTTGHFQLAHFIGI